MTTPMPETHVGTIRHRDLAGGIWLLVPDIGRAWMLKGGDPGLHVEGQRVEVQGNQPAPGDIVSIGMAARILEVESYCILEPPPG